MTLTKAALIAEIVGLVLMLVVVRWLQTTLTNTRAFWPLMIYSAIYLGGRAILLAGKTRSGS